MKFNKIDSMIGGFSSNDGTIDFYLRVGAIIDQNSVVLDYGAGRAQWFEDDLCATRKNIRQLRGKVKELIAADVDPAVLDNRSCDKKILISNNIIDLQSGSVDIVVADYVLEHIEDPCQMFQEIDRCLKSGGWFCARTPHKYSYVSIIASLLRNSYHSRMLKYVQPSRKEVDVFPTKYRLNTFKDIRDIFVGWECHSFIYRTEPAYYFGSKLLYNFMEFLHRLLPSFFCGNLFVFIKKP
jgi:SAM-dependent methyltransferase